MKYQLISIIVLLLCLSCSEEKLPLYNSGRYLSFEKCFVDDSISFSYKLNPGKEIVSVPVVLNLSGKLPDKDCEYIIAVDKDLTTAPDVIYEIPEKTVFRKDYTSDTLLITLRKDEIIKDDIFKLVLTIKENDNFKVGIKTNSKIKISISDRISKPKWWDDTIRSTYLGLYSDRKYSKFIEVTGVADLSEYIENEPAMVRSLALKFKRYLAEMEAKGTPVMDIYEGYEYPMTVPVIGY